MDTLVDSNVIIDVQSPGSRWEEWSAEQLERQAMLGNLVINQLVYAEVSLGFDKEAFLDEMLSSQMFIRKSLPWEAAFPAARAFREYRQRGGQKTAPLPDFYIGAHAQVKGMTLLTRDASRYRAYFPALRIIAPEV